MLGKLFGFLPLDSLAAKTKAEWKKSATVVLVQQWRSMKILLPKRGQVKKSTAHTNSKLAERRLLSRPRILRLFERPVYMYVDWKSRANG